VVDDYNKDLIYRGFLRCQYALKAGVKSESQDCFAEENDADPEKMMTAMKHMTSVLGNTSAVMENMIAAMKNMSADAWGKVV